MEMRNLMPLCVLLALAATAPATAQTVDHSLWDEVLKSVVVPNVVRKGIQFNAINFDLLRTDAALQQKLTDYLAVLAATDFTTLPKDEAVAFLINAYNAFATDLIVNESPDKSIMDLSDDTGSVFASATWPMTKGGAKVQASLDTVEHVYLRMEVTGQDEPRVHAAVNCMSLSCPDIRTEAYTGAKLDSQLTEQTISWLQNKTKGVRLDEATNSIWLSMLFNWFKDDFVSAASGGKNDALAGLEKPLDYALQFVKDDVEAYVAANAPTVKFMEYDWDLISS